jgi:allantoinase
MAKTMPRRIVVEGGTIVTGDQIFDADLVIADEEISAMTAHGRSQDIDADVRINASGLLVFPGGIDVHTHFKEPDPQLEEGFAAGSAGAAAGGITTVIEMPQAEPTTTTGELFREKRDLIARNAVVDIALWGGVSGGETRNATAIYEMAAEGAVAYKSFMASSSPSFPAVDTAKLRWAMETIAPTGLPYGIHAEDDPTLSGGLQRMQAAGRTDAMAHAESRPSLVETVAVNAVLFLAEVTGCWVHICHCASPDALRLIAEARSRGVKVTVETCPQYLALNTDDLEELKGFGRCAPAIRPQDEVDAIWSYVLDETVDIICSDHCAYTIESKRAGHSNIFDAPLGLSGIQTLLPVFWDTAVNQRGMDPRQFVRQISKKPAQVFGLAPRKGTIRVGSDADLVLFDPNQSWTARGDDMLHRNKWTPFEGKGIRGRVIQTIRRGETIYDDSQERNDRLPAGPGSGRFLPHGYGSC